MKLLYVFILSFFVSINLIGQNQYRSQIRSMFEKTSEGLWISHYEGQFDDSFPISLVLGISGDQCRAVLLQQSSSEVFTLEGSIEGNEFLLEEYDSDNQHTATIRLTSIEGVLSGQWVGIKEEKKYNIQFSKIKATDRIKECSSPFYNKYYSNRDKSISLTLKKSIYNLKVIYNSPDDYQEWMIYENIKFEEDLELRKGKNIYSIIKLNGDNILVRIIGGLNLENHHLDLERKLDYECINDISFSTKAEVHFPKTNNEKFNKWINKTILQLWDNQINLFVDNSISPYNRYDKELFIHTRITHYNERIISGLILLENKITNNIHTVPFIYSFDKERAMDVSDYFKRDQDISVFKSYIEIENRKNALLENNLRKKWLADCKYENIVLGDIGIELYSEYNILYGNNKVNIPYIAIQERMKYHPNAKKN